MRVRSNTHAHMYPAQPSHSIQREWVGAAYVCRPGVHRNGPFILSLHSKSYCIALHRIASHRTFPSTRLFFLFVKACHYSIVWLPIHRRTFAV